MKRRTLHQSFVAVIAAFLVLSLTACTSETGNYSSATSEENVSSIETDINESESLQTKEDGEKEEVSKLDTDEFSNLEKVFTEKIDQVLVCSNNVFVRSEQALWVCKNGEPKKILDLIPGVTSDGLQIRKCAEGYTILVFALDDEDPVMQLLNSNIQGQILCYTLDNDFEEIKMIDLSEIAAEQGIESSPVQATVSPNGQEFVCVYGSLAQSPSILFYNSHTNRATVVSDVVSQDNIRLCAVETCSLESDTNENTKMFFSGQGIYETGTSFPIYGIIEESGAYEIYRPYAIDGEKLSSGATKFSNSKMFFPEDTRYKDGRCLQIDITTMEETVIPLTDSGEGDLLYVSDDGRYLCTIGETGNLDTYLLRVYDLFENQRCVLEQSISQPVGARVLVLSDAKICVLVLYASEENRNTEIMVWPF